MTRLVLLACAVLLTPLAVVADEPGRVEVFPPTVRLTTARQTMHLIVTGYCPDGSARDLTRIASFAVADPQVAEVKDAVILPTADGTTKVTVSAGGHKVEVPVTVANRTRTEATSFRRETVAALTRQGCNAGSCHGSPSGKGGFSLSMMGYDPDADLLALVRSGWNRRTNVMEPQRSLLLRKPTMQLAHGGGQRLLKSDIAYRVLEQWISEGCRPDPAGLPACRSIQVYPEAPRVLRLPAASQQVMVLAHFADGSVRDVTALALFTSSDNKVAGVTPDGLVIGRQRGVTSINVRYLDEVVSRPVTIVADVPGFVWKEPARNNYIDDLVHEQLRLLNYLPAELCGDEQFIRRVYLDVTGLLPTTQETRAFLAQQEPDRRAKLIDRLLDSPAHARFWGHRTADLLRVNPKRLTAEGAKRFHEWIVQTVQSNMPYDKFATALLTASGNTYENPPANYYRAAEDTNTATETTAQLFLGVRIACAKCHNHPFESWTQDNYYGIAAVFNRVQRTGGKASRGKKQDGSQSIAMARTGDMVHPRTGKVMRPWLPLVGDAKVGPDEDPRAVFARWLTSPDNSFFARVEVNRIWAQVMGRGIVDPVDDFRASNPPANARLLDALADDFVKHSFDRKHVLRTILNSRTYQRSAETNDFNKRDERHFSAARVRLLGAEQIIDAVSAVTEVQERFAGMPAGTWATQMAMPAASGFLSAFGQPERETACSCERGGDPTLEQALQMLNGATVMQKVHAPGNRLQKLLKAGKSDAEIVGELYLAAFCRAPRAVELERALRYASARPDRSGALEDVLWALLNTKEFLFQH